MARYVNVSSIRFIYVDFYCNGRVKMSKPHFIYQPTMDMINTVLLDGLFNPQHYDADICPPNRIMLSFGQKSSSHEADVMRHLEHNRVNTHTITIGLDTIDSLHEGIQYFVNLMRNAEIPHVLILKNVHYLAVHHTKYPELFEYCSDLESIRQSMTNPQINIEHGILCLSQHAPFGEYEIPKLRAFWQQFDIRAGYGTLTEDERRTLFQWYFRRFIDHCNTLPNVCKQFQMALDKDDLDYLMHCSTQATQGHVKTFCQRLFRGVLYMCAKDTTQPVVLNRAFLEKGGLSNKGFLYRIGVQPGMEEEDDDMHSYCISPHDLVQLQDAIEIAAGRSPYLGNQPTYNLGQQRREERMQGVVAEEERIKAEEEAEKRKREEERRQYLDDDDLEGTQIKQFSENKPTDALSPNKRQKV